MIFVSPGFLLTDDLRYQETDILDRAIRANVRISSLNARGLYTMIPGGDASTQTSVAASGRYELEGALPAAVRAR